MLQSGNGSCNLSSGFMTNISFSDSIKKLQWSENVLAHAGKGIWLYSPGECNFRLIFFLPRVKTMVSGYPQGYYDFMKHFIKPALPFWKGRRGDGEFLSLWKWGISFPEDDRENRVIGQHPLLCRGLGLYEKGRWVELRSLSIQLTLQLWLSFFLDWNYISVPSTWHCAHGPWKRNSYPCFPRGLYL